MMRNKLSKISAHSRRTFIVVTSFLLLNLSLACPALVAAGNTCGGGSGESSVKTTIDLGCTGKGNPILDMLFAFIRFLSIGAGLVIIASLVYAGIQYTGSRGDPNANKLAVKRIQANVAALLVFIFAYAILNYLLPGQVLK